MALQTYRDLNVWQKSIDLVERIYVVTRNFPVEEKFGLTSQMRRAAVSVPANIAEGYGRLHRGDYLHHLSIAHGSLAELETHLIISERLEFISRPDYDLIWQSIQEIGKMLRGLVISLRSKP